MRWFSLLLMFLFMGPLHASTLAEAQALYEEEKYQEALDLYQTLEAEQQATDVLWYNMGNTYYRMGRYGHAAACYERALKIDPGMHQAEQNLRLVRSQNTDRFEQSAGSIIASKLRHQYHSKGGGFYLLIAIIGFWVAAFLLGRYLLRRYRGLNPSSPFGVFVFMMLALLFTLVAWHRHHHQTNTTHAVVSIESVYVKPAPSAQADNISLVHEGAYGRIKNQTKDWIALRFPDGRTGWLPITAVETY